MDTETCNLCDSFYEGKVARYVWNGYQGLQVPKIWRDVHEWRNCWLLVIPVIEL